MPTPQQLMDVISIQTEIAKLGLDLGSVMSLVVDRTLPLIGADGAAIELAEGDDMVYRAAAGIAGAQIGLRLKRSSSLSGLCVARGEILRCDDAELDPRVDREACRKVGLRAMIVMPLRHRDSVVGVLKAMSARPAAFGEAETAVLGLLSEVVGAAMYFAAKYDSDDLFHRATHDGLTGLANRALFMDRLRNALCTSARQPRPAAVLMIDMDGLKQINDHCGHRAGDAAIQEFAQRIQSCARVSDTVARLGGDEFGVLLSPVEPAQGVEAAVGRLSARIGEPFSFEQRPLPLSASIGVSRFPDDGGEMARLLDVADQRMYAVKRQRRARGSLRH